MSRASHSVPWPAVPSKWPGVNPRGDLTSVTPVSPSCARPAGIARVNRGRRLRGGPHGFLSIAARLAHADAFLRTALWGSRSSRTRAPTATTASQSGAAISALRSPTTRSSSTARISRSRVGRSCGSTRPAPTWVASMSTGPTSNDGQPNTMATSASRWRPAIGAASSSTRSRESVSILDQLLTSGDHDVRLAFHLGPTVQAVLTENRCHAHLAGLLGGDVEATMHLAEQLHLDRPSGRSRSAPRVVFAGLWVSGANDDVDRFSPIGRNRVGHPHRLWRLVPERRGARTSPASSSR